MTPVNRSCCSRLIGAPPKTTMPAKSVRGRLSLYQMQRAVRAAWDAPGADRLGSAETHRRIVRVTASRVLGFRQFRSDHFRRLPRLLAGGVIASLHIQRAVNRCRTRIHEIRPFTDTDPGLEHGQATRILAAQFRLGKVICYHSDEFAASIHTRMASRRCASTASANPAKSRHEIYCLSHSGAANGVANYSTGSSCWSCACR